MLFVCCTWRGGRGDCGVCSEGEDEGMLEGGRKGRGGGWSALWDNATNAWEAYIGGIAGHGAGGSAQNGTKAALPGRAGQQ